jgi:hypothetical protein
VPGQPSRTGGPGVAGVVVAVAGVQVTAKAVGDVLRWPIAELVAAQGGRGLVLLQAIFALFILGQLPQTGPPTPACGATALDEPDRVTRARERAAEAKAQELEAHRRAEELHEEAAVTLERLGRRDLARAALGRAQRARELYVEALREQDEVLRKQDEADDRAIGHDGE